VGCSLALARDKDCASQIMHSLALARDKDCASQIVHSCTPKWFLLAPSTEAGVDDDGRRIGSPPPPRFPSPAISGQATRYCSLLPCKSYAEVLKLGIQYDLAAAMPCRRRRVQFDPLPTVATFQSEAPPCFVSWAGKSISLFSRPKPTPYLKSGWENLLCQSRISPSVDFPRSGHFSTSLCPSLHLHAVAKGGGSRRVQSAALAAGEMEKMVACI
jgi:hypothetical protein